MDWCCSAATLNRRAKIVLGLLLCGPVRVRGELEANADGVCEDLNSKTLSG